MSHPYGRDYEDSRESAYEEDRGEEKARVEAGKEKKKVPVKHKKGAMAKKMFKAHGSVMAALNRAISNSHKYDNVSLSKKPSKTVKTSKNDAFQSWRDIDSRASRGHSNIPPGYDNEGKPINPF